MSTRVPLFPLFFFSVICICRGIIPEYIHLCKFKDPDVSKCITNSINQLKPKLRAGIPELDVPPFEPFHLDTIKLRRGFQSNITDLKVYGVSTFKLLDLKSNIEESKFLYKIVIPRLRFVGNYDLDMKILFLNIKGSGPIFGNITNYYAEGLLTGNKIIKNGKEYLKFGKMKLRVRFEDVNLRLDNLFNGDPLLGKATNAIINENSEIFLNEIKPALENGLAEKLTDMANKITLKFTYKELFL